MSFGGFTIPADPALLAMVVAAALIVGLAKSGLLVSSGALNVPLLTFVMSARSAAGVLLPVMLVVDLIALLLYARQFDGPVLARLLPGALLGTALGWAFSSQLDDNAVRLAVGAVTLVYVLYSLLFARKAPATPRPPSTPWGLFWGTVAGLTSFVSHTGAPPFQIYVIPQRLSPQKFAGTTAVFFAVANTSKIIPYYFLGQLEATNLALSALMVPIALLAMAAGYVIVQRIPGTVFYGIIQTLLLILAVKLLWDGIAGLEAGA